MSRAAVVLQRWAGPLGSFHSSFWVVLGKERLVLGAVGGDVLQHLAGNSNTLPLTFDFTVSGPWLSPVIHFPWESEEEKCSREARAEPLSRDAPRKRPAWLSEPGKPA